MSKNFGRSFGTADAVRPEGARPNVAVPSNDAVSTLRIQSTLLLLAGIGLCFVSGLAPVGVVGIVAGGAFRLFCPAADAMTQAMDAEIDRGNVTGGTCLFWLIVLSALIVTVLGLGGGLALFGEMAGRL